MPSSAQTIAAAGLVNGEGVAPSQDAASQYSTNNSKPIVVVLDSMFTNYPNGQPATGPNTVSNVYGLYESIKLLPSWVTGRSGYKKTSAQASAQASQIMGSGTSGVQGFATTLNQSAGYGQASLGWHAAIQQYQGKKFDDLGLQNKSYQDIASGGLTGHFSALKTAPGGTQGAFQDLGSFVTSYGNGIDVSKLNDMFGPAQFVLKLRKNGLSNLGAVDANLATLKIFTDEEVKKADYKVVRKTLDMANDSYVVDTVISSLGIKVPNGVKINNLGDLVDSNKMLPPSLRKLAPSGNLSDLNGPMGNMGGNFSSPTQLGKFFGQAEIPSYPRLDAQKQPLTDAQIAALAPTIGYGNLPAVDGVSAPIGTGPIGNPTITDMLGSASGTGFTDNYKKINAAHDKIMNSQVGQDVYNALKAVRDSDKTPPYTVSPTLTSTLDTKISVFNKAVKDDPEIKAAQMAMVGSIMQLARSDALLPQAGITLGSPPAVNGMTGVLNMAGNLPKYGVDKQQMGYNKTFAGVADKNSIYGEAILVSLLEGRNATRQTSAGVPDNITADPMRILGTKIASNSSKELTEQQKANIIDYAKKQGKDPSQALSNSKLFGYQNSFYVSKGYPDAS